MFEPTDLMVDSVALGWDFLRELQVPDVLIIPYPLSSVCCPYEDTRLPKAIFFGNRGALGRNVLFLVLRMI